MWVCWHGQTGGRAVLLMDYGFAMVPLAEGGQRCVTTPKGVDQCLGEEGASYGQRPQEDAA